MPVPMAGTAITLPFRSSTFLDRSVFGHHIFVGGVTGRAIAELVEYDAQVGHAGAVDGGAELCEGEVDDVDFAGREHGERDGGAGHTDRLQDVGFAEVLGDARLVEDDRRQLTRRHRPADTSFTGWADAMPVSDADGAGGKKAAEGLP